MASPLCNVARVLSIGGLVYGVYLLNLGKIPEIAMVPMFLLLGAAIFLSMTPKFCVHSLAVSIAILSAVFSVIAGVPFAVAGAVVASVFLVTVVRG